LKHAIKNIEAVKFSHFYKFLLNANGIFSIIQFFKHANEDIETVKYLHLGKSIFITEGLLFRNYSFIYAANEDMIKSSAPYILRKPIVLKI